MRFKNEWVDDDDKDVQKESYRVSDNAKWSFNDVTW